MGQIENTISVYERLSKNKYKITVENGIEFILSFRKQYYHHLVGYHYLTDIVGVSNPNYGKERFYRQLKNRRIREEEISGSALFHSIAERVEFFGYIEEIMSETECKIIVEFDKDRADSDIEARFFLYKREGNPLNKEPVTYYSLFIGHNDKTNEWFPLTYIVEHSTKYVNGQNMLNCKIELVENET